MLKNKARAVMEVHIFLRTQIGLFELFFFKEITPSQSVSLKYTHSKQQSESTHHNVQYKPSVLYLNDTILQYKPQPIITKTEANLEAYSIFRLKNNGLQSVIANLNNYDITKTKSMESLAKKNDILPKLQTSKKNREKKPKITRETTLIYNLAKTRLQANRNIRSPSSPIISLKKNSLIDNTENALNLNMSDHDTYKTNNSAKPFIKFNNQVINFSIENIK
jgi:hypothetical protein